MFKRCLHFNLRASLWNYIYILAYRDVNSAKVEKVLNGKLKFAGFSKNIGIGRLVSRSGNIKFRGLKKNLVRMQLNNNNWKQRKKKRKCAEKHRLIFQHFCLISGRLEFSVDGSRQKFYVGKGFVKVPKGCYFNQKSFLSYDNLYFQMLSVFVLQIFRSMSKIPDIIQPWFSTTLMYNSEVWSIQIDCMRINCSSCDKCVGLELYLHSNETPNVEIFY